MKYPTNLLHAQDFSGLRKNNRASTNLLDLSLIALRAYKRTANLCLGIHQLRKTKAFPIPTSIVRNMYQTTTVGVKSVNHEYALSHLKNN